MLSLDSTEQASNWGFTAVLDLLRLPAYGDASPPSARHPESTIPSSTAEQSIQDVGGSDCGSATEVKPKRSYPKLGDFGSLWDLLGQDSCPKTAASGEPTPASSLNSKSPLGRAAASVPILKLTPHDASFNGNPTPESYNSMSKHVPVSSASKPCISNDTISGTSSRSYVHPPAISILKRATDKETSSNNTTTPITPQTPPRQIPGASDPINTPRAKSKAHGKDTKSQSEWVSESSAEADSDSSTVIFDSPITKTPVVLAFVPTQVGTQDAQTDQGDTPPSSYDDPDSLQNPDIVRNIITTPAGIRVLPAAYKTATDRRTGLIIKLLKAFPEYAQLVSQARRPPISKKNDVEQRPVHVFIDMSNIMVGFHDSVKFSRNIPTSTRIRRLHMSFSNLSLIMERDRPAAKRVLVGSDRLPLVDEAEKLGYEANILDRVHKKHTTPRASKFRKGAHFPSGLEAASQSGNRWVEQGVDEILHLKILESLLDTDEPATIVLATGDAAEAEYSGGFMRMVERALQRGWAVELVSFSQVTSHAYRKKEFREKWGAHFRVIELDDYVEELFE